MKTLNTAAKMIALSLVFSLAISVTAFAGSVMSDDQPYYPDSAMLKIIDLDAEYEAFEATLRSEGVLECANTEIIVVLGENDEIVYQGSHQLEDENNAFVTRLLTKADFLMSSGGKSFYKVF